MRIEFLHCQCHWCFKRQSPDLVDWLIKFDLVGTLLPLVTVQRPSSVLLQNIEQRWCNVCCRSISGGEANLPGRQHIKPKLRNPAGRSRPPLPIFLGPCLSHSHWQVSTHLLPALYYLRLKHWNNSNRCQYNIYLIFYAQNINNFITAVCNNNGTRRGFSLN